MKKKISIVLSMLLCMLLIFAGCSTGNEVIETTTKTTEAVTVSEEIIVSDEVEKIVDDTAESVAAGEDLSTDEIIESDLKEEENIVDEGVLEADGTVEQENISYDGTNTGKGATLLAGAPTLTYYNQADSRWGSILYTSKGDKTQTIRSSGCGPTSAAMIITASKGVITPPTIAKLFVDNHKRTADNGTDWSAWSFIADYFDFDEFHTTSSFSTMTSYLKQDKNKDGISDYFVVASCGYGLWTTGGHYICVIDYIPETDEYICGDPYYYVGKYNTASRKAAKVKISNNFAYVKSTAFKTYSNVKCYWIYSNDSPSASKDKPTTEKPTTKTTTKYVKTKGSNLNVRKGPGTNYTVVRQLKNGSKVTEYETKNGWSRIGNNEWVSSDYLTTSAPKSTATTPKVAYIYVPATGRYAYCEYSAIEKYNGYYRLKARTTLYSKSNLTGTKYDYLAKTKVKILKTL